MKNTIVRWLAVLWITGAAQADIVTDWNARADAIGTEKKMASPLQARIVTLLHVAIFEALNAIDRRYQPYRLALVADRKTSREATAAAAGNAILVALYPEQKATLDAMLAQQLAAVPEGPARERGLILGRKAAADILELRQDDGSDAPDTWRPSTQPGRYVPTAPVASAGVGAWTPWVMTRGAQFRPPPPPAFTSPTWTRDVNEIREMGGLDSRSRSAEQTTVARFWFVTGPRSWDPVVASVCANKQMDLLDCARLFALTSLAGCDAYIAVFDAKYHYNFWRPVTAIRNADQTGNPATPREAGWLPLGDTPMHPEYPCAHCITAAAVAAVLRGAVGEDPGSMSMTSTAVPGVTRTWTSLDDYANEVSNARVWAGFHYRFSTEVGKDMGRKVGELVVTTQLKPRK
jgi:vanadium-dependent haloperoxidase-like protein